MRLLFFSRYSLGVSLCVQSNPVPFLRVARSVGWSAFLLNIHVATRPRPPKNFKGYIRIRSLAWLWAGFWTSTYIQQRQKLRLCSFSLSLIIIRYTEDKTKKNIIHNHAKYHGALISGVAFFFDSTHFFTCVYTAWDTFDVLYGVCVCV